MPTLLSRQDELRALRLAGGQPESSGELTEFMDELRQRVVALVLRDRRVRGRLVGARHRVLTADYREDKVGERATVPRQAEIGIYDYERDVLVVAVVDLRRGSVREVVEREGAAPPITAEELEEARRIAADAPDVGPALARRGARVLAFPTPSYAFEARRDAQRHRGCALYVRGPRGEELSAVVDLSARALVPDAELPEILRRRGR